LQEHKKLKQWIRFLAGGSINTCFTYIIYYLLQKMLFYQISYAIAYVVGVIFSYWFNACCVFKAPLSWKGLFTYPVVYVVQYLVSALFLGAFIELVGLSPEVGPLLVLILMIPLIFFMSRWVLRVH
jgi:putative flippase GtrA